MAKLNSSQVKKLFDMAIKAKEEGKSLGEVFEIFAKETGKAKGSVRNFFYATLKEMSVDDNLKKEYLGDNNISANQIISFSTEETDVLLRKILGGVVDGKSVRRSILEIAKDEKLALRYQNKYRNLLKNDRLRVEKIKCEIDREKGKYIKLKKEEDSFALVKLKREINVLCDRIARAEKLENKALKARLSRVEEENLRLKAILADKINKSNLIEIFDKSPCSFTITKR